MKIPKSVQTYKDEFAAIVSWLSSSEWLGQDDFDRKSMEWKISDRPCSVHHYTPDTIVPPINGDLNLAILQEMQSAGIVEARKDRSTKKIEYRLAE